MGQKVNRTVRLFQQFLIRLGQPVYYGLIYGFFMVILGIGLVLKYCFRLIKFIRSIPHNLPPITLPTITLPSIALPRPTLHVNAISYLKFILISFFLLGGSLFAYFYIFKDLPHPKDLITKRPALTTKIYDRNHQLLYKVYSNENRSLVSLKDLPPFVIQATLAIEDAGFYDHVGFSIRGILRAIENNLLKNTTQGGSTITQQLVKLTLLSPEKTLQRKLKELVLALMVENYFTKDEILTMYFNQVGYGGPAYGIEEAAQYYFQKSIKNVDLSEATLLAGLPAAPTLYSPYGTHPEKALARQQEVLRRMVELKSITPEQAETAKHQPIDFAKPGSDILAPHFVMYIKDLLAQKYSENLVNQGGLEVVTSLDLNIQTLADTVVKDELQKLKKLHITNAAVLVTKPRTGEILAMVGSGNYFDTEHDGQVNVTLSERQPGSSIKPLTYSLALENGFTATTMLEDSPVTFQVAGSPPYTPKNYDNTYHGKVTLRQALANSYNIPAVKVLNQVGVSNLLAFAPKMGITTWTDFNRYGLSLTLGGGEVKMTDMAVLYATLANYGHRVDLHPVLSITDISHQALERFSCNPLPLTALIAPVSAAENDPQCSGTPVIKADTAYIITNILSDNLARSQAFGTNSVLNIPGAQVAVKTGTTNSLRDNWTIGYTPDYLVAVWVGNNDNSPMSYVASGITGASPIWARIMTSLLKNSQNTPFIEPPSLIKLAVCPLTGTLTCSACPKPKEEYFLKGTEPKTSCSDEQIQHLLNPTPSPENYQPPPIPVITSIPDNPVYRFFNNQGPTPARKPKPNRRQQG